MQQLAMTVPQRRFMCLEDRLLDTVYNEEEGITLQQAAERIHITSNAAHSIVNRINKEFPHFLHTKEDTLNAVLWLTPHPVEAERVRRFLKKGGFTRINEQEFVRYYEKELKREKRQARFQHFRHLLQKRKWYIGTALLLGSSLATAVYLKANKGK